MFLPSDTHFKCITSSSVKRYIDDSTDSYEIIHDRCFNSKIDTYKMVCSYCNKCYNVSYNEVDYDQVDETEYKHRIYLQLKNKVNNCKCRKDNLLITDPTGGMMQTFTADPEAREERLKKENEKLDIKESKESKMDKLVKDINVPIVNLDDKLQ